MFRGRANKFRTRRDLQLARCGIQLQYFLPKTFIFLKRANKNKEMLEQLLGLCGLPPAARYVCSYIKALTSSNDRRGQKKFVQA